ncbi:phosphatidate cytidylyltransferase [Methylotenera sp. N17]|uniref:phosphatidate cytidylyltransferase n=1 Tax=Methylotenera sp. N17 TaxID=1502761 RepID=UPI0006482881|nr:phosphatidate cytidylyltransferase [Methylotenera sp. N17]
MPINLQYALYGVLAVLLTGTIAIGLKVLVKPSAGDHDLWLRIRSWWVMASLFSLAIIGGRIPLVALFAFISVIALKEYFGMISIRIADRHLLYLAYLTVPLQYLFVWQSWYGMFIIFIPVYMFLFMPLCMVIKGETQGFLKAVGTLHWGLMANVFAISHAAYLLALPDAGNTSAGSAGLLLFLVFLTQFNDVLQFVWGKFFGNTKVVPKISPNKTLAGLLGGVATTTFLAWLLAPYLTPLLRWEAITAGAMIGLGGFVGDVTMSAIKRDIGLKNTSDMIPGHGGILDRIDSLIFTAPLFFHFIYYLHY